MNELWLIENGQSRILGKQGTQHSTNSRASWRGGAVVVSQKSTFTNSSAFLHAVNIFAFRNLCNEVMVLSTKSSGCHTHILLSCCTDDHYLVWFRMQGQE